MNDPVNEPVLICVELDTNVGLFTTLAYSTNDAVLATEALTAFNTYDAVGIVVGLFCIAE